MIRTIVTQIKTHLAFSIPWVERISGLVTRAVQPVMVNVDGQLAKIGENVYPIADDLEGKQCFESGRYFDMLPSSAYKSVVYFEQTAPVQRLENKDNKGKIWVFQTDVRLVCWLNLKKFGEENPGLADVAMLAIMKRVLETKGQTLEQSGNIPVNDDRLTNARLEVSILGQPVTDRNIFARYSISEIAENLLYPFEFFAIDLRCRFEIGRDCFESILEADEVC